MILGMVSFVGLAAGHWYRRQLYKPSARVKDHCSREHPACGLQFTR
jgi:hypothetical protein